MWPCLLVPVLFAIAGHKCLLKLTQPHFYPLKASVYFGDRQLCWKCAPALSCLLVLSKIVLLLASTRIQQTIDSGHITAMLTSIDTFTKTYQEETYFRTIYICCNKIKMNTEALTLTQGMPSFTLRQVWAERQATRRLPWRSNAVCVE